MSTAYIVTVGQNIIYLRFLLYTTQWRIKKYACTVRGYRVLIVNVFKDGCGISSLLHIIFLPNLTLNRKIPSFNLSMSRKWWRWVIACVVWRVWDFPGLILSFLLFFFSSNNYHHHHCHEVKIRQTKVGAPRLTFKTIARIFRQFVKITFGLYIHYDVSRAAYIILITTYTILLLNLWYTYYLPTQHITRHTLDEFLFVTNISAYIIPVPIYYNIITPLESKYTCI